ncbi:DUF305 domain-containing protein [Micromonospora sp. NPDC023814]|uniref:DUF305 domain-containing protein n=1 Tax=Micromonospora sp. NPDC023814 TaxID=3154596 RepID=UPI0033DB65DF
MGRKRLGVGRGRARGLPAVAALVMAAGPVACAGPGPVAPAPVAPASTAAAVAVPAGSGTDVAWAQLTIALNERALVVLGLAAMRAGQPRLVELALDLEKAYREENSRLRDILARVGAPDDNPHAGHVMPGMADEATLQRLTTSSGVAFDRLLVDALVAHSDQCVRLAAAEERSGSDSAAVSLAATIAATRRTERQRLTAIVVG